MTNPPNQPGQASPTPRRIATAVGDWTRAAITVVGWGLALAAALTLAWVTLKGLLYVVELAQQALFPGGRP